MLALVSLSLWLSLLIGGREAQNFTVPFGFGTDNYQINNWEPFIVGNPAGDLVFFTTQYGEPPCDEGVPGCPDPSIVYRVSLDSGETFLDKRFQCTFANGCPSALEQNDPVSVFDEKGNLHSVWMDQWNLGYGNSPDLGQTWNVVHESLISPCCAINLSDKPWIAVTPDGLTVYITFNDRGVPKFVVSFDGGQSFSSAQKMTWPGMTGRWGGGGYFFAEGMGVTSTGRVCTSQSATMQSGTTNMWVICSDDSGATWAGSFLGESQPGPDCPPQWGCKIDGDFLAPSSTLAIGDDDTVYVLYTFVTTDGNHSAVLRSAAPSPLPLKFSDPIVVTPPEVNANFTFPILAASIKGDVRVGWMDDRNAGWWNIWYRDSSDFGANFSEETRLNQNLGAPFQSEEGYLFPNGDYASMYIDTKGVTHVVWGEGNCYLCDVTIGESYYSRQIT